MLDVGIDDLIMQKVFVRKFEKIIKPLKASPYEVSHLGLFN
jgi:hypothetical protein